MILTIKNQVPGTRSYLGGIVTVPEDGSTVLPRDLNVIICADGQFLSDVKNQAIFLNNGFDDLNAGGGIELIKALSAFSTDPIATLFLYYSAVVNIRQSDSEDAGTAVWAMRNHPASPYSVVIERIFLSASFGAATPLTGINTQRYDITRFSGATPTGGTQITPVRASTLAPASIVDVRAADTGLGVAGLVLEASPFAGIGCPEVAGAMAPYERERMALKLAPGEGAIIRVSSIDAVVGQGLQGEIVWSLR